MMSNKENIDFELLLELKKLALETSFKIEQDKNNKNLFYLTEPNATIPFATLDYNKEIENARANPTTSTLRECSTIFLRRIRGIIQEREDRSRAEIARSSEIQTGSGSICEGRESICGINGNEIWRRDSDARVSFQILQQRNQSLEETNHLIQQSQSYKQQAYKAYQQNGATLAPNPNNPQQDNQESQIKSMQEAVKKASLKLGLGENAKNKNKDIER